MKIQIAVLFILLKATLGVSISCSGTWMLNEDSTGIVDKYKAARYFVNELNKYFPKLTARTKFNGRTSAPSPFDAEDGDHDMEDTEDDTSNRRLVDRGLSGSGQNDSISTSLGNIGEGNKIDTNKTISTATGHADNNSLERGLLIKRVRILVDEDEEDEEDNDEQDTTEGVDIANLNESEHDSDDNLKILESKLEKDHDEKIDDSKPIGLNKIQTDVILTCTVDGQYMQQVQTINMACARELRAFNHYFYFTNGDVDVFNFPFNKPQGQIQFRKTYSDINYISYSVEHRDCSVTYAASTLIRSCVVLVAFIAVYVFGK